MSIYLQLMNLKNYAYSTAFYSTNFTQNKANIDKRSNLSKILLTKISVMQKNKKCL